MTFVTRRTMLTGMAGLVAGGWAFRSNAHTRPTRSGGSENSKQAADFVSVDGIHFRRTGRTFRYAGANIWYGAYLGADAAFGDRARLIKELDDLKALGIVNLRVLGSSELSPLKNSLDPAFTIKPGEYNDKLLTGLDFLLSEMGRRDMQAVLYLTNFWEWSGGLVTYQYYHTGHYIDMNDPAHPWPAFADLSAQFYAMAQAKADYWNYVRMLVGRRNSITGKLYREDPAIMAWQLCNEPRAGGSDAAIDQNAEAYLGWIKDTSALIRSLDPNHLISLGHEGLMGVNNREDLVVRAHEHVDYVTAHIWPQNWSWVDPKDLAGTFDAGAAKVQTYIDRHIAIAKRLNKPLVFEEFGFPRDYIAYDPGTPTTFKDKFYGLIYAAVEEAVAHDTPVAGSNFWAWGGSGRALQPDHHMLRGETAYVGDPPHEPQGWYSVFNTDTSTQALIKAHAARLAEIKTV